MALTGFQLVRHVWSRQTLLTSKDPRKEFSDSIQAHGQSISKTEESALSIAGPREIFLSSLPHGLRQFGGRFVVE
jgi:hypothetical protein